VLPHICSAYSGFNANSEIFEATEARKKFMVGVRVNHTVIHNELASLGEGQRNVSHQCNRCRTPGHLQGRVRTHKYSAALPWNQR